MTRYVVKVNTTEGDESQTVDILTLEGTRKAKRKQWRAYLQVRCGITDYHQCNAVARSMGFKELVK